MSEQLDRIEKYLEAQGRQLNTAVADIASVKQTLGGNKSTGAVGLYEDFRDLKKSYYKTKAEVVRMKWTIAGITTSISAIWAGIVTWYNS